MYASGRWLAAMEVHPYGVLGRLLMVGRRGGLMRSSLARGAVCIFLGLCGVLSLADGALAEGWDPSTHVLAGSEIPFSS